MENDNYKPNRYAQRHPKAVVRPFFAAVLQSPFIVPPMMSAVDLPDCKANPNCLLELGDNWEIINAADMQTMLNSKADLLAIDLDGMSVLHYAAQRAKAEVIHLLLDRIAHVIPNDERMKAYVNKKVKYGDTPLHMAAGNRNAEVIPILVKAGAKLEEKNQDGATPLYLAAHFGYTECVNILHQMGADLNASDEDGNTPLTIAKEYRHWDTAAYLEKHGAK